MVITGAVALNSSIPSFPERLSTLVMARWPWQLISSEYKRLHYSRLQKRVVEQRSLEFFQDDGQFGSSVAELAGLH